MNPPHQRHAAHIAALYTLFAAISTVANIGAQDLVVRAVHFDHAIALSVLVGTGVGLVIKYVLDKRYIFRYQTRSAGHDGRTFLLYTLMGVVTTVIFWGVEFGFQAMFGTREMRYLGGVIGLAIGYLAKYRLDKRFVFRD
ncbi:MAG: GtrA family protein [Ottowia sp.]|nr:GtrA family protein [Ottowia sp.]MCB2036413.1 GtrA family protein [Ottowia sp.]MCB2068437.1 GtrA family protein [Ottowia sp.]HPK33576.1 GtrA family protein [Ottowia sp.]